MFSTTKTANVVSPWRVLPSRSSFMPMHRPWDEVWHTGERFRRPSTLAFVETIRYAHAQSSPPAATARRRRRRHRRAPVRDAAVDRPDPPTMHVEGSMSSSDLAAGSNRPSPEDQRRLDQARDLVAQMRVPERIAMLHQYSPGVERLGIGPFVTGTEGLDGVAWKGRATQFPQPVGMAASWYPDLLAAAAAVTAQEVRELHAADPTTSLSVWAPVVNTLRHPLWGRSEEAFTEDPLLNGVLAGAVSRGLRGDGSTWQVLPTLKHFLAYSNETDRCLTDSQLSPRVLHEYELPGFVAPIASGEAASVMLSYNLVNGRPAHLTDLLESQLRSQL